MRKIILELGPVVLSYGCVLLGLISIILDLVNSRTTELSFFLHILMTLCWCIVAIKWTIQYRQRQQEE